MTCTGNRGRGSPGREPGGAPFAETQILLPATIATRLALPSAIPAGELRIVPVPFRDFRVLFRPGSRFSGKVVHPCVLRALLYQFSHGGFQGGEESLSDGETGAPPGRHG